MAKKDKKKGSRPGGRTINLQFQQDLTAERYYNAQVSKAEKLYADNKFGEALKLLEPLVERFYDRPLLFEQLGLNYANAGLLVEAQEALERAISLAPKTPNLLAQFNLVQIYVLAGYNFMAYQAVQLVDCYELARQSGETANNNRCRDFREACRKVVEQSASENNRELESFMEYGLASDRGRQAVARQNYEIAREQFLLAISLDAELPAAYNNLALVYLLDNQLDLAEQQVRTVLEKIDGQNLTALTTLLRVKAAQGDFEAARAVMVQIEALPEELRENYPLRVAEAYATLEEDERLYELLRPMLADPDLHDELDSANYEQAVVFAVIAAANLGGIPQAMQILRNARKFAHPTLLERTVFALENGERGPRPRGRFFYFDPVAAYPPAATYFQNLAEELDERDSTDYREALLEFFRKFGNSALEVAAYKYWIDREPELVADLLNQALESGIDGSEEMVRRLAFTRAGDDLQRLTAAGVLAKRGMIDPNERLRMWIGQRQMIGTMAELTARYQEAAAQDRTGENNYNPYIATQLNEALEQMRRGDAAAAINTYTRLLDKNPQVKQAHQNLAALLSGQGDIERALVYIQRALSVDPDYVHAQIALAQLWLAAGDLEKTEAQLESLQPKLGRYFVDELEAYYAVQLSLYHKQGRQDKLKEVASKLLELDPENPVAGEILSEKGGPESD